MLERIIAESCNEQTGTDTHKRVLNGGMNPACGLLSFLPNPLKGMGPQKGRYGPVTSQLATQKAPR